MLSLPYCKCNVGAFFNFSIRLGATLLFLLSFIFTVEAQQPEVAVRFANPQYNCETRVYCLDVEFQSDQEGQELFGMNVRFFYDDVQLELIDFRDFQGGYAPFLPNPAIRNTGSANSGSALFDFLDGHPAEFINGAIILDNPEAAPIVLPTNDWEKIFQVCFEVTDPNLDPSSFCPTVVWDLEAPANGGFLRGDDGVVMTVLDQSGRFDSQPAVERVVHHNWSYNGPGRRPYGTPESIACVTTSCDQHPEILITKSTTTTSFSAVGDRIDYQLILENTGDVPLNTIRLQDDNADPGSIAYFMGDDGNGFLDPGESWIYGAKHTATQADLDAGAVWNVASVSSEDPNGDPVGDLSNEVMVPAIQDPLISLIKDGSLDLGADGIATPGDLITYTFMVENRGNVTLHNVAITDPLPGITMNTLSDLAGDGISILTPGAVETATATYPITQSDIDVGFRDNVASVIGNTAAGTGIEVKTVTDEDDHQELIPVLPAEYCTFTQGYYGNPGGIQQGRTTLEIIEAALSSGPLVIGLPGRSLSFGLEDAQCIIDLLPGNGSPQPLPANLGDLSVNARNCNLGPISLDKEGRIKNNFLTQTITLMLNTRNDADLCALPLNRICGLSISDAVYEGLGSNATVCDLISCANDVLGGGNTCALKAGVLTDIIGQINERFDECQPLNCGDELQAGLTIEKSTISTSFSAVGETINYIFKISNTGDVPLEQVLLEDAFVDPYSLSCPAAVLEPGESMYCTATHTITPADLEAGEVVNIAAVSGVSPDGQVIEVVSNEVIVPAVLPSIGALEVEKQGELISCDPDRVQPGDYIRYTIVVRNPGSVRIDHIRLQDDNADAGSISCGTFDLEPGASWSCTAIHTLTQADIDAGSVSNTAIAIGNDPAGNRILDESDDPSVMANVDPDQDGEPDDPTVTLLAGQASLELIKTADRSTFGSLGEQITFQFIIRNTGSLTLSDLILEDEGVDAGSLDCFVESLAPGAFFVCSAVRTVSQADLDAGQIINVAAVSGLSSAGEWVSVPSNELILNWTESCAFEPVITDCVSFSYLGRADLEEGLTELCFNVQVDCQQSLSNMAFDVQGQAVRPLDGALITGNSGAAYQVQYPTNRPFRSGLKFETVSGEVANGGAEQFCFTVPSSVASGLKAISLAAKVGKKTYMASVAIEACTATTEHTLISGRLFEDADADGCRYETEAGLDGVPVILYDEFMEVITATETQTDGLYQFSGIAPGNYRVGFLSPQSDWVFTEQQPGCTDTQNSDADAGGLTPVFNLSAGGMVEYLDAGVHLRVAGPCTPQSEAGSMATTPLDTTGMDLTPAAGMENPDTSAGTVQHDLEAMVKANTVKEPNFELLQNVPNPFREQTTIGFYVPEPGKVELRIHDAAGRTLQQFSGFRSAGYHQFTIQRSDLSKPGLMYYTLITGGYTATRKMIMLN